MRSANEAPTLPVDLTPSPTEGPALSPTCGREHADASSYAPHGHCFECGGLAPATLRPLAAELAIVSSPEALTVEAEEGRVRVSWRRSGRFGARVCVVLGVPEAHNLSDVCALAAQAGNADRATETEAAAAVFPGMAGFELDEDSTFEPDEVAAWSAAGCDGGRIVLGFAVYSKAKEPPRATRLLVGGARGFASRVLGAAAKAQQLAQDAEVPGTVVELGR